jgi:V8-like Glu-specific endopeptidase
MIIVQDRVATPPQADDRQKAPRARTRVAAGGLMLLAAVGLTGAQQARAHGTARARAAIADGVPVAPGAYRFAVKLTMTDIPRPDGSHYNSACSAALIARQWIVTAGHCFHDVNRIPVSGPSPYNTTATVGVADLSDPSAQVVAVTDVIQSRTTDVAVAKLAPPIRGVRPLRLSSTEPTVGERVRLAGWGSVSDVNPTPVTRLQTGVFTISSLTTTTLGVQGYLPAADTSACLYDSGAPYFREAPGGEDTLVSIESTGPACPHSSEETTARIDNIAWWIHHQIRHHDRLGRA